MQLQGIRITYFINGGIAILWMYPILWFFSEELNIFIEKEPLLNQELLLAFIIPFLYVLGMLISFTARSILNKPKRKIQQRIYKKYLGEEKLYQIPLLIETASKDNNIYERLEENLTAQLIARGTVLSLILSIVTHSILLICIKRLDILILIIPLLLFFLTLTYFMWRKHQYSYYKNQCFAYLHNKGIDILDAEIVQKHK